jgi:hypothetical protein
MANLRFTLPVAGLLASAVSGCALATTEPGASVEPAPSPETIVEQHGVVNELGTKARYPEGPYGLKVGDVAPDLAWEGLRRGIHAFPSSDAPPTWETIALHDYYDPTGEGGIRAIKIDVECVW